MSDVRRSSPLLTDVGPCLLCGANPAEGHAWVNEDGHTGFLCHGDETPPEVLTCFEEWTVNRARP